MLNDKFYDRSYVRASYIKIISTISLFVFVSKSNNQYSERENAQIIAQYRN